MAEQQHDGSTCKNVITYIIGTLKPAGGQALLLESDITWTEVGHELGLFHTCSNDLMADNDGARGTSYTPTGLTRGLYRNKWGL